MKTTEKYLVAALLFIVAFGGIGMYGIMPVFDGMKKKLDTIATKETQIKTFETSIQSLKMQVIKYQKLEELPEGLVVREFKPDTYEKNIKSMIDQALSLVTQNGNELISLKPWNAPTPAVAKNLDAEVDENGQPKEPETNSILKTYGYELVFRGAYDNINGFLQTMNTHNELMEINSIQLENETGQDREQGQASTLANPLKPIKVSTKLTLFLQNQS